MQHIIKEWADYLLINQLEISSIRVTDDGQVVATLNNRHSRKLFYILLFKYWNHYTLPDFRYRSMHDGADLTASEVNKLRARTQQVLNSVLRLIHKEDGHQ